MAQLLVLRFLSVGVAGVWYNLLPLDMCICRPRFQSVNLLKELPVFWVKVFDKQQTEPPGEPRVVAGAGCDEHPSSSSEYDVCGCLFHLLFFF